MTTVKAFGKRILGIMVDKPSGYKQTKSGLFVADKDKDISGVRPRWFKLYSVGEEIDWVREGQYAYVEHGRWSNGVKVDNDTTIYLLDNNCLMLVSDEAPEGLDIDLA